ncbi:hypothetical protein WS64_25660 [Burkholderia anthina]|uniref:Uncharacterized protein n=1 Tax=Burkholderia anthina TaxID=179879 RepID=A0AAW3PSE1_9BURK|nr:hypothetical protein WS64_25660 [Burkholderia anthina]
MGRHTYESSLIANLLDRDDIQHCPANFDKKGIQCFKRVIAQLLFGSIPKVHLDLYVTLRIVTNKRFHVALD